MNELEIIESFKLLKSYCEREDYNGWDPYDGLNSKLFQALPFFKSKYIFREILIQAFKRSPINLRRIFMVPKGYNPKGIGLFLNGYCNLYKIAERNKDFFVTKDGCVEKINYLGDLLLSLQTPGYNGACWGYNFDWQSRAFFLPKWTPTVVATSFVVEALLNAYEITREKKYYETAISSANFILKDLNRIEKPNGYMFSYSPLDKRAVYNATLLGSKTLALIYKYTNNEELKEASRISVKCVCDTQNDDGSFPHSDQAGNTWRDSFHTGFKLESIKYYQELCRDYSFKKNLDIGYKYWIENFFVHDKGIALYYDRNMQSSLIDLHCTAQTMPTLYKLGKFEENQDLANRLLIWAINNMQDKDGFFYFQKKGCVKTKIQYMRWPNGWMFYGYSYWLMNNFRL